MVGARSKRQARRKVYKELATGKTAPRRVARRLVNWGARSVLGLSRNHWVDCRENFRCCFRDLSRAFAGDGGCIADLQLFYPLGLLVKKKLKLKNSNLAWPLRVWWLKVWVMITRTKTENITRLTGLLATIRQLHRLRDLAG